MAKKRYTTQTSRAPGSRTAPVATPPPTVDDRWFESSVPRRMLPAVVESILINGLGGDLTDQMALFTHMQDTWARLQHNVRTLREAVESAPFEVHAWSDDDGTPVTPTAEEKAALVSRGLWGMCPDIARLECSLEGALRYLAGGTVQGHAVMEVLWEMRTDAGGGTACLPRALRKTGSSHYAYATGWTSGSGEADRLLFRRDPRRGNTLTDFPEHQFLTGIFPGHDGHPSVAAPLRSLAKYWIAATYGPEWLLSYAQLFGSPFRWATYEGNDKGVKAEVCRMLANLGNSGWGAFPSGTKLELKEASKGSGDLPQKLLIDLADQAADILILGQTLSADTGDNGGGSFALGKVHQTVRRERLEACGKAVATVLTHQLARSIIFLNYGNTEECPEIRCDLPQAEDEKAKAERDNILITMGLPIGREYLYERHGIPAPADGEETVGGAADPLPEDPSADPAQPGKPGAKAQPGKPADKLNPAEKDDASEPAKAARADLLPDPFLTDVTNTLSRAMEQAAADAYNAVLGEPPTLTTP